MASVPPDVIDLCERLRSRGKRAWIVGGCVRDLLLGRVAADWDVATDARPKELLSIFPRAIPTGIEHGTVTVVQRGQHYEVTTLRGEGTYSDGRRPDWVEFVDDITADLARRDFTVNAMAIDPVDAQLIDPFDGRGDLGRGVLRAVGDPHERFAEDGLRVLRAARFVATLELELDPDTRAAIRPTLDTFRKVAMERVRDEWVKAMKARAPSRAFEVMRETGILEVTCPELLEGVGLEQNQYHAYDVWRTAWSAWTRASATPCSASRRSCTTWASPGRAPGPTRPRTTRSTITTGSAPRSPSPSPRACASRTTSARASSSLVRHHLFHYDGRVVRHGRAPLDPARRPRSRRGSLRAQRGRRARQGPRLRAGSRGAGGAQGARRAGHRAGAALSTRDLKVNGHDLIRELGLRPGPIIGQVLDALLEVVTSDPALQRARAAARRGPRVPALARRLRKAAETQRTQSLGAKNRSHTVRVFAHSRLSG